MSTETRLLYIRKSTAESFEFINYDIKKYNFNCYYFNFKDRYKIYNYKESSKIPLHILGYDNSYESVCEYYLIYNYLKDYKKIEPNLDEIIKILYFEVNKKLYQYSKLNLIYCPLKTIDKSINNFKRKIIEVSNKPNLDLDSIYLKLIKKYYIKYLSQIKQCRIYIDNSKESLQIQKEHFLVGNILPHYIYEKQINNIDFYYNNFDIQYKKIIKLLEMIEKNSEISNNKLFYNLLKKELQMKRDNNELPINKIQYFNVKYNNKLYSEIKNIL